MPLVDELADRLDLDPDAPGLTQCIEVAAAMVDPYSPLEHRIPTLYTEAVVQLAVKVWEERGRGRIGMDPEGDLEVYYTPGATAGLVRSVWAYIQPLNPTGGLTV